MKHFLPKGVALLLAMLSSFAFASLEGCEELLEDFSGFRGKIKSRNNFTTSLSEEAYEAKIAELMKETGKTRKEIEAAFPHIEIKKGKSKKESDREIAEKQKENFSNKKVFEKLAKRDAKLAKQFIKGKDVSFEFVDSEITKTSSKTFKMGEPDKARDVTLTKPFEMMKTTVTQLQWYMMMRKKPSGRKFDPNKPVVNVTWKMAQEYIKVLNRKRDGFRYRLPTDAEWEYMARAHTTTPHWFGENRALLDESAWYDDNSGKVLQNVAEKKPNPFGLFDMYGNAWQWCEDSYSHLSPLSPPVDPIIIGPGPNRIIRGGSFSSGPLLLSSDQRLECNAEFVDAGIGFRLVRERIE